MNSLVDHKMRAFSMRRRCRFFKPAIFSTVVLLGAFSRVLRANAFVVSSLLHKHLLNLVKSGDAYSKWGRIKAL